jgi:hypothetical protein
MGKKHKRPRIKKLVPTYMAKKIKNGKKKGNSKSTGEKKEEKD